MSQLSDLNGLAISTGSEGARAAFDRTLRSYTGNRVDISDHLGAALAADPQFALGHCVKGYLMMLMYNAAVAPKVRQAHACLLYTSDAADDSLRVDLGGRRIIKKKIF